MELEIVTFEQAKVLKELGFPQNVKHNYTYASDGQFFNMLSQVAVCIAPTLELVAKWLREEKNIHIDNNFSEHKGKDVYDCFVHEIGHYIYDDNDMVMYYSTYEEALSAGIDKAIEILKGI